MKRFILSAAAVSALTAVSAQELVLADPVEAASSEVVSASVRNFVPSVPMTGIVMPEYVLSETQQGAAASKRQVLRADATSNIRACPMYYTPDGAFYGTVFPNTDGKYYYTNAEYLPPMAPVTFTAGLVGGEPTVKGISWSYIDYTLGSGMSTATTQSVQSVMAPSTSMGSAYYSPTLAMTLQEGEGAEEEKSFQAAFVDITNYVGKFPVSNGTMAECEVLQYPYYYQRGVGNATLPMMVYGNDVAVPATETTPAVTYTEMAYSYIENTLGASFKNFAGEDLKAAEYVSYFQEFPKAPRPYALSEVTVPVYVSGKKGNSFDITFYRLDDKGAEAAIVKKQHVELDADNDGNSAVETIVKFTSEDPVYGDELDYQIINFPMRMKIENFENCGSICPVLACVRYSNSDISMAAEALSISAYGGGIIKMSGDTRTVNAKMGAGDFGLVFPFNGGASLGYPICMPLILKVEYPYLYTDLEVNAENVPNPLKMKTSHNVVLNDDNLMMAYRVLSPAWDEYDISISGPDGGLVPEWVSVASQMNQTVSDGAVLKFFMIQFTLDKSKLGSTALADAKTTVQLEYKGEVLTFNISTTPTSGITAVGAEADVVASEYFDLMGRKLNGEPETGLFIRKDLKADGTTTATKIVK